MVLLQTRIAQPLVVNDCILSELINDKVSGIYQTWFPTLLESFLTVQVRKNKFLTQESSQNINVTFLQTRERPRS